MSRYYDKLFNRLAHYEVELSFYESRKSISVEDLYQLFKEKLLEELKEAANEPIL